MLVFLLMLQLLGRTKTGLILQLDLLRVMVIQLKSNAREPPLGTCYPSSEVRHEQLCWLKSRCTRGCWPVRATVLTPVDRHRRWIQGGLDLRQAGYRLAWDTRDLCGIVCLSLLRPCFSCQQLSLSPALCPSPSNNKVVVDRCARHCTGRDRRMKGRLWRRDEEGRRQ